MTDNTEIRGGVTGNTAFYIEKQIDSRVEPLALNDARQDVRIEQLESKVTTLFTLINRGAKGTVATSAGGGVLYVLYEFLAKGAP